MPKKYTSIDVLASYISKYLSYRKPVYDRLTDEDYITILSWCEDWEPEDVYYTAWNASAMDMSVDWEKWSKNMTPLPGPVKYQLRHALEKHEKLGNLRALRAYAFVYEQIIEKWIPRILWITLGLLTYYLFF